MDDFANILHRDYGLKPQGKSAPMSAARSGPIPPSIGKNSSAPNDGNVSRWGSASTFSDGDLFSGVNGIKPSPSSGRHTFGSAAETDLFSGSYEDAFGAPPKFNPSSASDFLGDAFKTSASVPSKRPTAPSYEDDIFGGVSGINGTGSVHDDIFNLAGSSVSAAQESLDYDNLLGDFGTGSQKTKKGSTDVPSTTADFEELLPGFGKAEPVKPKSSGDTKSVQEKYGKSVTKSKISLAQDSFSIFGQDSTSSSGATTPISNLDPFVVPDVLPRETNRKEIFHGSASNNSPFEDNTRTDNLHPASGQQFDTAKRYLQKGSKSSTPRSPGRISESIGSTDANYVPTDSIDEKFTKDHIQAHQRSSAVNSGESRSGGNSHRSGNVRSFDADKAPKSRQNKESTAFPNNHRGVEFSKSNSSRVDEYWISVEDIKLVTKPSVIPPPSRSPPMPGSKQTTASDKSSSWRMGANQDRLGENGHSSSDPSVKGNANRNTRILDEFEEFASGGSKVPARDLRDDAISPLDDEQVEGSAAATASGAAMKEAIERAEAKLRQAKEAKNKDKGVQTKEERSTEDLERELREANAVRDREEKEKREKEREARERHRRERAREKEREKERERERERRKDRANEISQQQKVSVEGINSDVRAREPQKGVEQSAAEAKAKAKAERQAVARAMAEAKERHDRAAVERAKAAEKERAAAAAATEPQRRTEDDIESFFMSSTRPTSAPKQRSHATDLFSQRQQTSEGQRSPNTVSNVKKVPSMPTMVDDLSSLFGGPPAPGEFHEIEGEPEDRRRARWERQQRTLERAAKALDEKRQRDMQSERDQAERHRAGEVVDAEIKRWAAGKEGNLRALLSTLHYVLWPECGWQPVTLTEVITAAAVKKVYKKATLCVHPDKVQQKGATIHQKYVAEKVFDLLKEAWNKFNSEELF